MRPTVEALRAAGVTVPALAGGAAVPDAAAAIAAGADGCSGPDALAVVGTVEHAVARRG